jgi:ribosome maturation factor RimP
MIAEAKVRKMIETHLSGGEIFPVDVVITPGNHISVFIDGDHGVTIEACRELSQFLNESLDRDAEDFELTVSSAGADRPLKLPRQFKKNLGRQLDVVTNTGEKFSGILLNSDNSSIELEIVPLKRPKKEQEKKIVSLKFTDIKSAKEVITFKQ